MAEKLKVMVCKSGKQAGVYEVDKVQILESIMSESIKYLDDRDDVIIIQENRKNLSGFFMNVLGTAGDFCIVAMSNMRPVSLTNEQIKYYETLISSNGIIVGT